MRKVLRAGTVAADGSFDSIPGPHHLLDSNYKEHTMTTADLALTKGEVSYVLALLD